MLFSLPALKHSISSGLWFLWPPQGHPYSKFTKCWTGHPTIPNCGPKSKLAQTAKEWLLRLVWSLWGVHRFPQVKVIHSTILTCSGTALACPIFSTTSGLQQHLFPYPSNVAAVPMGLSDGGSEVATSDSLFTLLVANLWQRDCVLLP